MTTLKKQAKSLTIKASFGQILLGAAGAGIAIDQLVTLVGQYGTMLPPAWVIKVRLVLGIAQIVLGMATWYGRWRLMKTPPPETMPEQKL